MHTWTFNRVLRQYADRKHITISTSCDDTDKSIHVYFDDDFFNLGESVFVAGEHQ